MTEKQLITKLQELKQIKPSKDWTFSVKMQILEGASFKAQPVKTPAFSGRFWDIASLLGQRKFAYAFCAVLLVMAGTFGFAEYLFPANTVVSPAAVSQSLKIALVQPTNVKSSVETFKKKSQDLVAVVNDKKYDNIPMAIQEVKDATNNLTNAITQDPASAKDVALELKSNGTLAEIEGGADLKESSDILYKTIDQQMLKDLGNEKLTESQQAIFEAAKSLFDKEDYSAALEKILSINS